jgi:hypothetical protein
MLPEGICPAIAERARKGMEHSGMPDAPSAESFRGCFSGLQIRSAHRLEV